MKILRTYQQEALDTLRARLKETTDPLLVNASVGAGKSLIIAELLKVIERANWRALCLTMNSILIEQNSEAYEAQGGNPGIYCSGLGEKNIRANVIFASPHSVAKGIKSNNRIKEVPFNLIVIDEAHNINHHDRASMYMRILNHYGLMAQTHRYNFRVVGLTGTPYRGRANTIVGKDEYFKEEVCSITTSWLISEGYLVPPRFAKTHVESFDMARIHVDSKGKFKHKDLEDAVNKNVRLTGQIMAEVVSIVEGGKAGAFIFASTIKHAEECMRSLPPELSVCITGETPQSDRKEYIAKARRGEIKYLVNVATLLVGVDVPNFDVCAWLRPTESLTLYTQGIGRVLRLSPGKEECLVLDYAGNLERHGDIDDPIINAALKPDSEEQDPEYCIPCYTCGTHNKITARRCIGDHNNKRCDYYFMFKPCDECGVSNDVTARHCRECEHELIDPNEKLSNATELITIPVYEAQYWVTNHSRTNTPIINVRYKTDRQDIFESYFTSNEKCKNIFWGRFVKHHIENYQEFYPHLTNTKIVNTMIHSDTIKTPNFVLCKVTDNQRYQVIKKIFQDEVV